MNDYRVPLMGNMGLQVGVHLSPLTDTVGDP